jgi:hypothetical protein
MTHSPAFTLAKPCRVQCWGEGRFDCVMHINGALHSSAVPHEARALRRLFPSRLSAHFYLVRKRSHLIDSSAQPHQWEHCLKMASVTLVPGDLLADRTRPEFS